PLKFTQFITTMSLSILVEAFIIFLPCIAPIMFLEKDYNRKRRYNIDSSIDKIKMILTTIPVRFIDRLYDKVVVNNENMAIISEREKKEIKPENLFPKKERPQLKLIKSTNYLKLEPSKPVKEKNDLRGFENKTGQEKKEPSKLDDCNDIDKKTYEYKEREDAFSDAKVSDEEDIRDFETARKLCIEAIKDLRKKDVCPSVDKISKHTGLKRDKIREVKKVLEQEGYIRTEESERKTYILSDYLKGGVKV
ncbi:MAG: hypothetical protein JW924_01090, partial [Fusobacteriaceae bacterium]|nr:hypothetical protein [Fusobacteriaceae bacterium]